MRFFSFFLWILFLLCYLQTASPVQAQEVLFQDDFSQGLTKWKPIRDDGSMWKVVDGKAEVTIDRRSYVTEMIPKDQYWNSAWTDMEYELDFTPLEGVDRNISFGVQDLRNWYEIHFVETFYNLVRVRNGQATINLFKDYVLTNGKTYRIKIQRRGKNIQIYVDGQKIADDDDWSFDNNYGRVGLKAGTGSIFPTRAQFDNVVVRSLVTDGKQLNVELWKQSDPLWRNEEYDTASKWASDRPGIGRWGCALTSMVMVMRYHGITTFPNGDAITPLTVNTWLKSQVDGYLGEGAINWQALTRLTRLISERFGTVKLEYVRTGPNLELAKQEINANKPVILHIDGHFLVGDGVTADNSTLHIKDPAYTYTKFSQHKSPLLSVRTFQPSHTDLSYLLVVHKPELKVSIKNIDGTVVSTLQSATERITDPESGNSTHALVQQQIAKPKTGQYVVEVSQPVKGPFDVQILTYDDKANVVNYPLTGTVGPEPVRYVIQYAKQAPSSLQSLSHQTFRQDLALMKKLKYFTHEYAFGQLDRTAQLMEGAGLNRQNRYLQQLMSLLKLYQRVQHPLSYQFLQESLQRLQFSLGN